VNTTSHPDPPTKAQLWTGGVLSALPVFAMLMSAGLKLAHPPQVVEPFTHQFGWSEHALLPLAIVEISCALLYAIPRTAVLGAVLVTGYLGGAIATHGRIGDPGFVTPLVLGIIAWGGLFLRDPRLHALLPLRKS
jgi:DoxX-like protein